MKLTRDFRIDNSVNVIKRSPPLPFIRVFKNSLQSEIHYSKLFEIGEQFFANSPEGGLSTADIEYSSMISSVPWPTAATLPENSSDQEYKIKNEYIYKKIDPSVIASALEKEPKVSKKNIINLINRIHFTKEQVSIHCRNNFSNEEFLLQGNPGPYQDDVVSIRVADSVSLDLNRHTPLNVIIDNKKELVVFQMNVEAMNKNEMVIRVPEKAYAYSKRQAIRHTCENIRAEIVQGQISASAFLGDINPYNLRLCLNKRHDFNPNIPLFVKLHHGKTTYFFGECRVVRSDEEGMDLIIEPIHNNRPVLKVRKYPTARVRITPQPVIRFIHPLCGLSLQYKLEDISTSGFSIEVPDNESLLIPGMIIPQVSLQIPGMSSHLRCTVQVIYRHKLKKNLIRYGFYILDMSLHEQRFLYDAVSKVVDPHVNLTSRVNMDSLWELFFDSGFIYPDKYGIISPYKEILKETYRKLYHEGQDIFTHLTYQDQGQVYGHLSMVKAYENSWIIHHLAARPLRGKRTGLKTLNHFVNYLDCLYRLPVSSKTMRYNFCYYRPENSFSDFYFGGVCKIFNNREICSMDLFGYMPMNIASEQKALPSGYCVEPFSKKDLAVMRNAYEKIGGGMMLDAFALEYRAMENEDSLKCSGTLHIKEMYEKVGLKRDCKVYSLRKNDTLQATLIVDTSDLGVNMSELLNSIKVIVIEKDLPWPILQDVVSNLGNIYGSDKIMILIYPYEYLMFQGVDCKKRYNFWVLNTNLDSESMDIVKRRAMTAKRKYVTETFIKELQKYRLTKLFSKFERK